LALIEFLFACWILYISLNSYSIILQGLQRAYVIYVFHLVILIAEAFIFLIRPLWKMDVNDVIFDSPVLCTIWGRLWGFMFFVPSFLVTLFSFQKAKLYLQTQSRLKFLPHFVWSGVLPLVALVIFYESGPILITGNQSCATISRPYTKILVFLCFVHFIIMNFTMIYVFCRYANSIHETFRELEHQLKINCRVVPLMAISSAVFLSLPAWGSDIINNWSDWNYFATALFHFVDGIFNNMIMHYTLFGHAAFLQKEQLIQQRINDINFDVSDDVLAESGNATSEYWIDLPGHHPIRVTHDVVKEIELWEYIVTDKKLLRQIRKYKRRNQIASLYQVCCSSSDLLSYIESTERKLHE